MCLCVVVEVVVALVELRICNMVALRGLKVLDEAQRFEFLQVDVMYTQVVLVL